MADFQAERQGDNDEPAYSWYWRKAEAMKAQGATWFRFSYHPDDMTRIMIEGWKIRPEREGDLKWSAMPVRAPR